MKGDVSPGGDGAATGLALDRTRLARIRSQLESLFQGLPSGSIDWRPAPDRWSVGECALHVLTVNDAYLDRIEAVIAAERAAGRTGREPFRYGPFARFFLGQLEPRSTRRLPTARMFRPPRRQAGPDVEGRLDVSLARLARALEDAEGLDLARAKVASPVTRLLRFPLGIALRMLVAHTDRHLRQMERVLAAPGWPAGGERVGTSDTRGHPVRIKPGE